MIFIALHRINHIHESALVSSRSLTVSIGYLVKFIKSVRSRGWEFYDIDAGLAEYSTTAPGVVLTLDDGYIDNKNVVVDLLLNLGVPVCIYITTAFVDKSVKPWWIIVENIIQKTGRIRLPSDRVVECKTRPEKDAVFLLCRSLVLKLGLVEFRGYYTFLVHEAKLHGVEDGSDMFLSWRDVKALSQNSGVIFGSHSITHPVLSSLPDNLAMEEIGGSKNIIESKIGIRVNHFASPYGDRKSTGPREIRISKELRYQSIATMNGSEMALGVPGGFNIIPRLGLTDGDDFDIIIASYKRLLLKSRIYRFRTKLLGGGISSVFARWTEKYSSFNK